VAPASLQRIHQVKESSERSSARQVTSVGQEGTLVLIGGKENKVGDLTILSEFARLAGSGKLVIATLASEEALQQWDTYRDVFTKLGVKNLQHLAIATREQAVEMNAAEVLRGTTAIFFTGGDQLKIASKLGGTSLLDGIRELYEQKGIAIGGTSAGASVMGEIMLVSGGADPDSHNVSGAFNMARGIGLVRDLVIDQHFAQRARIERLVGAVAEDPGVLGIGIDENTAVILRDNKLKVLGSGAVYVADGHTITYTNISETATDRSLCLFDMKLHVLTHGSGYDLGARRPFLLDLPRATP
jgi:cyanophycinase